MKPAKNDSDPTAAADLGPPASDQAPATPALPQVLLWAEYPGGNYRAAVQSDGRTVYFVIQDAAGKFAPRLVWVRNLKPAPLIFSPKEQESNEPPMLPESYCAHPRGAAALDLERTKILWFEQGIGAVLVEGSQVLAMIPPIDAAGLPGFAADCLHASPVALPLDDDDIYFSQLAGLEEYWQAWSGSAVLQVWQDRWLAALQQQWGPPVQLYSSQAATWPPIRIAHFQSPNQEILTTIGTALRHQPGVEKDVQNFADHQRMELAITVPANGGETQRNEILQWLLGLARYPWHYQTYFLATHTIDIPAAVQEALLGGKESNSPEDSASVRSPTKSATARLTAESTQAQIMSRPEIPLPDFRQQAVNLLWIDPR